MGVHIIKVPDVGEGIAEVELVSWSVSPGDAVRRNQILAEVMTDKANVEIPAPSDGVIASLNGEIGATLAVGSALIEMTVESDRSTTPPSVDDVHLSLSVSAARHDDEPAAAAAGEPAPDATATVAIPSAVAGIVTGTTSDSGTPPAASTAPVAESVAPTPGPATPVEDDVDRTQAFVAEPAAPGTNPLIATGSAPTIEPGGRTTESPGPAAGSSLSSLVGAAGERPLATPAVRHKARQAGIDLRDVVATGPAGRITHADLDAHDPTRARNGTTSLGDPAHTGHAPTAHEGHPTAGRPDLRVDTEPIIGIRRQIARRMLASTQSIPHITYVDEVDVTALESLRSTLNAEAGPGAPRLTLLPFLIRAMVAAIDRFPQMNAHVDDEAETLTTYGGVHVGIATQTPNGLVVPVIRHAEAASLWSLAARVAEAAETARSGRAAPGDLSGSTITISSLGPLGGLVTTPVINKPEVAIVGVNKIVTRPVFADGEGGAVVARKLMNLSSSFDHRIIDGWDAASFIQRIKTLLESPALLFVDAPSPASTPAGALSGAADGTEAADHPVERVAALAASSPVGVAESSPDPARLSRPPRT